MSTSWGRCAPTAWTARRRSERVRGRWFTLVHALLKERDVEALSLREVARDVGVSGTSVYRHFPDKAALMTALAVEGLAQLGAQRAAADASEHQKDAFAATGRAYVRFAIANAALSRLIFASPILAAQKEAGVFRPRRARFFIKTPPP